jgi:hypothetical protein
VSTQETRQRLDEYLDGVTAAGPANPAEAKLLAAMKSERALRAAAFESHMPSAEESSRLAAEMMAAAYAPVGRVGESPLRKLVGVAAAIAVLAGTFAIGRMTASPATTIETSRKYVIVYTDQEGLHSVSSEFDTEADLKAYVASLEQNGAEIQKADAAEVIIPGEI